MRKEFEESKENQGFCPGKTDQTETGQTGFVS
jgi:hypothetical protein